MSGTRYSPALAACLALCLVALGFIVGYGYHVAQPASSPAGVVQPPPTPGDPEQPAGAPPTVKGLRISPDGRTAAFTGVYDTPPRASRFLLDLQSGKWSAVDTPLGWQDYTMQWSADGRKILFDREKIPREAEDTTAGLYEERVRTGGEPASIETRSLTSKDALPPGEKSVAGFWAPDGSLVVKTRREPKALYRMGPRPELLDRASGTFLQNRAVRENGRPVYYVVRDIGEDIKTYALFRTEGNGPARRLSPPLRGVEWSYVSEDARWMIVCRKRDDGDWDWTLYKVTPQQALPLLTRAVPGDVIAVFWSPDFKCVLGASGKALWCVDIPSLETRQIGERDDWNADDAAWLVNEQAVVVAADGVLWKVAVPSGAASRLWQFPQQYRK